MGAPYIYIYDISRLRVNIRSIWSFETEVRQQWCPYVKSGTQENQNISYVNEFRLRTKPETPTYHG